MFDTTMTVGAILGEASTFSAQIVPVALVVVGAGVALGLTGWVIKKMRRAAR